MNKIDHLQNMVDIINNLKIIIIDIQLLIRRIIKLEHIPLMGMLIVGVQLFHKRVCSQVRNNL